VSKIAEHDGEQERERDDGVRGCDESETTQGMSHTRIVAKISIYLCTVKFQKVRKLIALF
jgi:hypothetical protein